MDRNDIGWRGNFTAVTTPFKQYGEVDEALFQQNIDLLIQEGIDGIIPSGSTGEVSSLTDAERVRLYELTVEVVAGRVPIVAGTAHVNTDMAVALSKKAKAIGADGLMLTPPHYALPNKREVFEHFQEVSSQVDLPISGLQQSRAGGAFRSLRPRWPKSRRLKTWLPSRRARKIFRISWPLSDFAGTR